MGWSRASRGLDSCSTGRGLLTGGLLYRADYEPSFSCMENCNQRCKIIITPFLEYLEEENILFAYHFADRQAEKCQSGDSAER